MKVFDILEAEKEDVVGDEPTYVRPDTAEVAQHVYPYLVQKIAKLNKRATKNKLPEVKLEIVKEYTKKVPAAKDAEGVEQLAHEIPYYTIKVTGDTPRIAGYKFIATIEHQEAGNIIRTVPGEEGNKTIKDFYEAKPHYCDHCKKIRARIDTFIIKDEKTGKLRQIGRNCLGEFLGGADPKAILWYFNNRDNILKLVDEAGVTAGQKGARAEQFLPLEAVLEIGAALVRTFGYMSSKKAQEVYSQGGAHLPTTAGDTRWILFSSKTRQEMEVPRNQQLVATAKDITPADQKQVKDILTWFAAVPEPEKQANEFMHNLDVIVKSNKVNPRNIGYALALFPVYARAMGMIKSKDDQAKKSNEWLGQPGQKLAPTKIKVIRTRMIEGPYGSTQIVAMEDPDGNHLTWFNNSANNMKDGDELTITGTIKKHDTYNGKKQTHIMRVKEVK